MIYIEDADFIGLTKIGLAVGKKGIYYRRNRKEVPAIITWEKFLNSKLLCASEYRLQTGDVLFDFVCDAHKVYKVLNDIYVNIG